MIDLRSYTALETAVFVKWEVPNFSTAYVSDYNTSIVYGGNTYTNIGNLLSVSGATSELKASAGELVIGLSGVPTGSIADILNQEIKGSTISVYRAYFNATTHSALNIIDGGNVELHFKGIVTNYSVTDTVDIGNQLATSTITLTCNSMVEILNNKVNGRRTNPTDFPNESSMSRVQALANSNFNFGAP